MYNWIQDTVNYNNEIGPIIAVVLSNRLLIDDFSPRIFTLENLMHRVNFYIIVQFNPDRFRSSKKEPYKPLSREKRLLVDIARQSLLIILSFDLNLYV